jgi:hypothetical protein
MRKLTITTFVIFMLLMVSADLFAIGVKPLSFSLIGKPGAVLDFKVTVNPADKPGIVKIALCKVTQSLDGRQNYEPVNAGNYPPAGWFAYPSVLKLTPGNPGEIAGKIKIPFDAKGDYNMLLMVTPESETVNYKGVNLAVRYGVQLFLQIDRPGVRSAAEITNLDLIKNEQGMPEIRTQVKNTSDLDYATYAYATIRDSHRKLIQKIDLLPGTYRDNTNLGDPILFPGSELLYTGKVTEFLEPGQYEVRLFYRYAENGQILQTKTVDIQEGAYKFPAAAIQKIKVSPQSIDLEARPGTMAMKAVKFENRLDKPLLVTVEALDIQPDYAYSIFDNTEIDLKGGKQFTLGAHQTAMKIITVKFAKNAPVQGNYGRLKIKAFTDEAKPDLIEEFTVNLRAVAVGDKKRAVEFTDLSGDRSGGNYVVSAMFKNTGNIDLAPKINLQLQDKADNLVAKIDLGAEERESISVLPAQMATVTGNLINIKPGDYEAIVTATDGDTQLGSFKFSLKVK